MNIKDAKIQIVNAMRAYFTKDEFGNYRIAPEAQRPVFLMGPPGIGKTAIMKQVADELGVGLVSYSMTHHTRQSALGLPVIKEKIYNGKTYSVSEYTMSEIIASVYDVMEEGNVREGILFLDEINCVSETLTPTMLQFLQYKVFGKHRVPSGWLVVAAGNPAEYNRAARDFDIVTWDRLKRIDIDPDYGAFREYAWNTGVHPAVLTYLDARKENFYRIETGINGKSFVTARSWVDLSDMIKLYEPLEIPVDEMLIGQYLQNRDIASDFAVYYDLFNKYRSDYQIEDILSGHPSEEIKERAVKAAFDERLSLLGLLLGEINRELRDVIDDEDFITKLLAILKKIKEGEDSGRKTESESVAVQDLNGRQTASVQDLTGQQTALVQGLTGQQTSLVQGLTGQQTALVQRLTGQQTSSVQRLTGQQTSLVQRLTGQQIESLQAEILRKDRMGILTVDTRRQFERILSFLKKYAVQGHTFADIKSGYDAELALMKSKALNTGARLENLFLFVEQCFGSGSEMTILLSDLSSNIHAARFIARYGCNAYYRHSEELMFYKRRLQLSDEVDALES